MTRIDSVPNPAADFEVVFDMAMAEEDSTLKFDLLLQAIAIYSLESEEYVSALLGEVLMLRESLAIQEKIAVNLGNLSEPEEKFRQALLQ